MKLIYFETSVPRLVCKKKKKEKKEKGKRTIS